MIQSRLSVDIEHLYADANARQFDEMALQIQHLQQEISRLQKISNVKPAVSLAEAYKRTDTSSQDRIERVEAMCAQLVNEIHSAHVRVSGMRLDRQIIAAPKYLWDKIIRRQKPLLDLSPSTDISSLDSEVKQAEITRIDVAVICPVYPGGIRAYGGEFIQKRVRAYAAAGLKVCVIEVNPKRGDEQDHNVNGVRVLRCGLARLKSFINDDAPLQLAIHQLERPVWDVVKPYVKPNNVTVWIHGFEARHWRELEDNFSKEELVKLEKILDDITEERRQTMQEVLSNEDVRKVFVSTFMKGVAEEFSGQSARNAYVIHNPILAEDFPYQKKKEQDRLSILWVRSFSSRNYSNDQSRDAILKLSKLDIFGKLSFTICGDGKLFEESVGPLRSFENVSINQQFVQTSKLRELHRQNGIMLVPSRWDSQGLTCGEAMSSGLVAVTSRVAALPEFVDDDCGLLCEPDNPESIADGIEKLVKDPALFLRLSKNAAKRSQKQCGAKNTVLREVELLRSVIASEKESMQKIGSDAVAAKQ